MSHLSHNGDLHILPCMIPIVHKLCSITYTIYMLSAENACWDKFAESTQYYHIYIIILLDIACIIESCKELPQKDLISVTQKTHNIFAASSAFKLAGYKWLKVTDRKWPFERASPNFVGEIGHLVGNIENFAGRSCNKLIQNWCQIGFGNFIPRRTICQHLTNLEHVIRMTFQS